MEEEAEKGGSGLLESCPLELSVDLAEDGDVLDVTRVNCLRTSS